MIIYDKIFNYANKYRNILSENEDEYLINRSYKTCNFYMNPKLHKLHKLDKLHKLHKLPKLHKSKELNEIIKNRNSEYVNITEKLQIQGRPIVAGPVTQVEFLKCNMH